jgi:hypothetical protein
VAPPGYLQRGEVHRYPPSSSTWRPGPCDPVPLCWCWSILRKHLPSGSSGESPGNRGSGPPQCSAASSAGLPVPWIAL